MLTHVSRWINANSFWPLGKICVNATVENDRFVNLVDFIRLVSQKAGGDYILIKTVDLPLTYREHLPPNLLCFNTERSNIVYDSIQFVADSREALAYDYVVIYDHTNGKSWPKLEFVLAFLAHYRSRLLLLLAGFFLLLNYALSFTSTISLLIIGQLLCLYLVGQLNRKNPGAFISSFCHLGKDNGNSCQRLKQSTGKILGYFEFSDLSYIYFSSLLVYSCLYLYWPESSGLNLLMGISIVLGALVALYSAFLQLSTRIICPVCVFVITVCFAQLVFLPKLYFSGAAWSVGELFLLACIPLVQLALLFRTKSLEDFKQQYFREKKALKEVFTHSAEAIAADFRSGEDKADLLPSNAAREANSTAKTRRLTACVGIDCGACIRWLTELVNYHRKDTYALDLLFHISIVRGDVRNSPFYRANIMLAYLLKFHGISHLAEALDRYISSGRRESVLENYLQIRLNGMEVEKFRAAEKLILEQNELMDQLGIDKFPFILYRGQIIPAFVPVAVYEWITDELDRSKASSPEIYTRTDNIGVNDGLDVYFETVSGDLDDHYQSL